MPPSLPPSLVSAPVTEPFGDDGGGLRVRREGLDLDLKDRSQERDFGALNEEGLESGSEEGVADSDTQFQRIARQAALDPGDGIPL